MQQLGSGKGRRYFDYSIADASLSTTCRSIGGGFKVGHSGGCVPVKCELTKGGQCRIPEAEKLFGNIITAVLVLEEGDPLWSGSFRWCLNCTCDVFDGFRKSTWIEIRSLDRSRGADTAFTFRPSALMYASYPSNNDENGLFWGKKAVY